MTLQTCKKCSAEKPLDEFYVVDKRTGRRRTSCKACHQERVATYKVTHAPRISKYQGDYRGEHREDNQQYQLDYYANNKIAYRDRWLTAKYGLTHAGYMELLESQCNACAVCGTKEPGGNGPYFHVDHDHVTGRIRGVLCHHCNIGLGHIFDSPEIAEQLAAYLRAN